MPSHVPPTDSDRRRQRQVPRALLSLALLSFLLVSLPAAALDADTKLAARDGADGDRFGRSVAVDGDRLIVGAPLQDRSGFDRGAAYIYVQAGDGWKQQGKLTAGDAEDGDVFGHDVAIAGDLAVVGAPSENGSGTDRGAAYVFAWDGTSWSQQAKLTPDQRLDGARFGVSVAIDGETVLVGADKQGAAFIFSRAGTAWSQQAKLTADDAQDDLFGVSVSLDGRTALVAALFEDAGGIARGGAYVFTEADGAWSQKAKLTARDGQDRDHFGVSVGLDRGTAIVGANYADAGGSDRGAAYVFVGAGSSWSQQAKLTADDAGDSDWFGISVDVDGHLALIGAMFHSETGSGRGAAYAFTREAGAWSQQAEISAGDTEDNDWLGFAVALGDGLGAIGAPLEDGGGTDRGAAYLHRLDQPPISGFTWKPDTPQATDELTFTDTSTDPDGRIEVWSWTFGDGNASEDQAPDHAFAKPGTYDVCLTVSDDLGVEATTCHPLTVSNHPPLPGFTWSRQASGSPTLTFEDTTLDPDGTVEAWSWAFGDGDGSSDRSPTHTFPDDGTYEVCLTVADDRGANRTLCRDVAVANQPPTAGFTWEPTHPTTGQNVSFKDASGDEDGQLTTWFWRFGDGTNSTQGGPMHAFQDDGPYEVCLTVTDEDGAPGRTCQVVAVANRPPKAAFTTAPSQPHALQPITFQDGSQDPDGTIRAWRWDLGDGTTSADPSPAHTYDEAGTYRTCLEVTDDDGNATSSCRELTVQSALPQARFDATTGSATAGETILFEDASTDPDGTITAWRWTFGDGATSAQRSPSHVYSSPGTYNVSLTVTDDAGQTASTVQQIQVEVGERGLPVPPGFALVAWALAALAMARLRGRPG